MTLLALDPRRFRSRRRRRPNWRRVLMCAVLCYAGAIAVRQAVAYVRLRSGMAAVAAQMRTLAASDRQLRYQAQELHSTAFLRQAARKELGLVLPGEMPFQPVAK